MRRFKEQFKKDFNKAFPPTEKIKYNCPNCKKSFYVESKDADTEGLRCPFDCGYYSHP